uniref:F-box/LRR-repeat protein 15-like leucin rich repeat domain-containing protein n=1 Tax=Dunaliella tertiolecta TaxID=3047 RepID=A0A7S3QLR1_DUNTE
MKRQRDEDQEQGGAEPGSGRAQMSVPNRRAEMADIARRRAAHFANYAEDDPTDDNVHAGGKEARTLGPWSSAVELVNAREQAAEQRRLKMAGKQRGEAEEAEEKGEAEEEAERLLESIAAWRPSRDPKLGPRPRTRVQPLFELCIAMLVDHVDCIDSLFGVPDVMRVRLAEAVCASCKMEPEVSALFAVDTPGEVVLPSCVLLDPAALSSLLAECITPRLERLELGFVGRGFGDAEATLFAQTAKKGEACGNAGSMLDSLTSLLLGGAYRLSDAGVKQVLGACPRLQQLSLPQASRLTGAMLDGVEALAPSLRLLNLTECRGIGSTQLAQMLPKLTSLERLVLDGINPESGDEIVTAAASIPPLRALSVSMCTSVTDASISALAAQKPDLQELKLDWCSKVSDAGILALAEGCKGLQLLSVRRCVRLSDGALSAVARCGKLQHLAVSNVHAFGPFSMAALAACCAESLETLDISFCRAVTDAAFGLVADRCQKLKKVSMYGCSQITSNSLHGHGNEELACSGIEGSFHQATR